MTLSLTGHWGNRSRRDAAIGMGATPTQVTCHVVLHTAMPGILTGVMLAIARAAGETAPLLFTALFSDYWLTHTLELAIGDAVEARAETTIPPSDVRVIPDDLRISDLQTGIKLLGHTSMVRGRPY